MRDKWTVTYMVPVQFEVDEWMPETRRRELEREAAKGFRSEAIGGGKEGSYRYKSGAPELEDQDEQPPAKVARIGR